MPDDNIPSAPNSVPKAAARSPWRAVKTWIVLAILAAGIAVAAIFARDIKDRLVPRKFRTVDDGRLYASGQIDRHLLPDTLSRYRIGQIVCLVGDDPTVPDSVAEIETARQMHIDRTVYRHLSGDGTGDIHDYAMALADIVHAQQAGKVVLMHCFSGEQRSNGATFFYRVLIEHRTPKEAMDEIIANGLRPESNDKLVPYLRANLPELAKQLVQMGVIERVPDPMPQVR